MMIMTASSVKAADRSYMIDSGERYQVKATAYCLKGTMKNGQQVYQGAVAYAPETIGMTMLMWEASTGQFLGFYDICDTGSEPIRNGYVVDVWINNYDDAIKYGSKDVLIQIVNTKG